jgi:hypothetical protein
VSADELSKLCRGCGKIMKQIYPDFEYHLACAPGDVLVPGTDETFAELEIRESITDIITWADGSSARSRQVALGCSEIGDLCQRKIAMTMAGLPQVHFGMDPWPSIVGTSIHSWLEKAVNAYQKVHGDQGWLTELEVLASEWLPGHIDLYRKGLVLDLKNPSRTNYRKMLKEGIGDTYYAQIQGYGLGVKRSGRPVDRVGIIFLPRDGNLGEMRVKTFGFDEEFILAKIASIEDLGDTLIGLDLEAHPERWAQIPATPSRLCGWCKFYDRGLPAPSNKGCPGTTGDALNDMFS